MTLLLVGAVLLLCVLPALLFLGLWYGLIYLQGRSLVTRSSTRAGCADPAVSWGDVVDAYTDPQKRLFTTSSSPNSTPTRADRCPVCATENDAFVTFCQNCCQKLR